MRMFHKWNVLCHVVQRGKVALKDKEGLFKCFEGALGDHIRN